MKKGALVQDIRAFVLTRNKEQSAEFSAASERYMRRQYRAKHPTEIAAFKCMDGRLNLAVMTKTPAGIIQPFRNIGGRFDLGWPFLGETVKDWVEYSIDRGAGCIALTTFHYSKGDTHRGCAGFGYDTTAARAQAEALRTQFERVFGKRHSVVYPILVGIETDEESLTFYGARGKELSVSSLGDTPEEEVRARLAQLFPDMSERMRADLMPLVLGNRDHVRAVCAQNRTPIDMDHREQIIAVGRGFDWLHEPNRALIVGPYSHEWPNAVKTAASIVLKNFKEGRVSPKGDALLLISALSRDPQGSAGWNLAEEKAQYLARESQAIIEEGVPELTKKLSVMIGVVDAETRKLHLLK